jgi:gamma-glutamylcyclotransferase (GGCT)/AIG2-like uncharacterized protein YtfP
MKKCRVFVYGTLKRGHGNNRILANTDSKFIGTTKTDPKYTMVTLGSFPGVVQEGVTPIQGEVWEVDERTLEGPLDMLEGYPSFYDREITPTEFGDAWIYYLSSRWHRDSPVVEGGEW